LDDWPIVFPPNAFRWPWTLLFVLGIAAILLGVIFIGTIWYEFSHGFDPAQTARAMMGPLGIAVQGIAEILVIAYVLLLLPSIAKTALAGIGLRRLSFVHISAIVAGVIGMFAVVSLLSTVIGTALHFKQPEAAVALFSRAYGWQKAEIGFFAVVVAPVFEEAVFRWTLFNALRRWWGFWPGAIGSSLLFGIAHSQPPPTLGMFASITCPLAVGGLVLCLVYNKTNNAWASVITHGTYNGISLVLLLLFPQLAR
jgi:membrane protease YdiL (CAAX protease family)